jgi:hypothetical protein
VLPRLDLERLRKGEAERANPVDEGAVADSLMLTGPASDLTNPAS